MNFENKFSRIWDFQPKTRFLLLIDYEKLILAKNTDFFVKQLRFASGIWTEWLLFTRDELKKRILSGET